MKLTDRIILPKGKFRLDLLDKDTGSILFSYEDPNILVLDSKTAIVTAIAGIDSGFITELKVGTDVGSGTQDSPEDPDDTYNETTMENPYSVSQSLISGFTDATTVAFSATAVGADVVAAIGGGSETSVVINSAALHTKNGKVFSYKRYPRISVSDAVNISFLWSIGY